MAEASRQVLITGGSGYLGQFLVRALAGSHQVAYTYHSKQLAQAPEGVRAFQVDLRSGDGLPAAFASAGPFAAVVNCAAVSQPGLCEKDEAAAAAVNVPSALIAAMAAQRDSGGGEPLLVHLSTDQVYDGTRAMWREDEKVAPINAYGRTKVAAEKYIRDHWPRHAILRSSIIYGDAAPGADRPLFLQFVEGALRSGKPTTFFSDEYRCPVYVADIVRVVEALVAAPPAAAAAAGTFNMGGSDRLSRADMARAVAVARGLSDAVVVEAPSSSVQRPYASPADISMDSSRLAAALGLALTPFAEALRSIPEWHPPT